MARSSSMAARRRSYICLAIVAMAVWMQLACLQAHARVTVAGSVYCDRCLEGHRTVWSTPIRGAKVTVECKSSSGAVAVTKEASTDMLGLYSMKLADGAPNDFHVAGCSAKVQSSPESSCSIGATTARPVSLSWKLFGMAMYTAEGLSFKPSKPGSLCPHAGSGAKKPGGISLPPLPFVKLSACSHEVWLDPKNRCYWRVWSPGTKVSVLYGPAAKSKLGVDYTLEQGLRGSGEVRRTLLRESITASLNAFNSLPFYYNAIEVAFRFNQAINASDKDALAWALKFRRANSGYNGKAKCLLTPCK